MQLLLYMINNINYVTKLLACIYSSFNYCFVLRKSLENFDTSWINNLFILTSLLLDDSLSLLYISGIIIFIIVILAPTVTLLFTNINSSKSYCCDFALLLIILVKNINQRDWFEGLLVFINKFNKYSWMYCAGLIPQ